MQTRRVAMLALALASVATTPSITGTTPAAEVQVVTTTSTPIPTSTTTVPQAEPATPIVVAPTSTAPPSTTTTTTTAPPPTTAPPTTAPPATAPPTTEAPAPAGPREWHHTVRVWVGENPNGIQAEVDRGGLVGWNWKPGHTWIGGHNTTERWVLDVAIGDHVVIDGVRYEATGEMWVQKRAGQSMALTEPLGQVVLQTCGSSTMRVIGLHRV